MSQKKKTTAQSKRPRKAPSNQTGGTAWGKKVAAAISGKMQSADMKKLILLNFPYIIAFYMVEKAAWLYRHCNGDTIVDRLMVLFMNFGLAYKSYLPSVHPFDLLVGLIGAAALKAVIYFKGKNAKKYRQGEEYGSARWGNAKDIEPFIDPVFENNVLFTQTERLMMSGRPKHPKYARNKNVIVIGGSGSGKTRFFVKPNLMQMPEKVSYVCTDPKGTIIIECGKMLSDAGYKIKVLNTINFKKSMHYNPFHYIRSEKDILKLVNTIIANTKGDGEKSGEDFWVKAERLLYCALIGYIYYEAPEEEQNFSTLLEFINASEAREDDEEFKNPVDELFEDLEKAKPEHFAVRQYKKYKLAAGVVCSKRLLNQAVGKSLRTHNLKPKKGAQVMRKNEKITALYERLSRDDFGKDDDQQRESNSISNQKAMLEEFAARQGFTNIVHFTDDGISGTCFDRPEFERLLKALQERKIDCIVVKDFSRLGRNFVETGQYLEQVLPLFGVRFIAINDNYDSLNSQSRDGMLVPIKSMINEMYSKDLSQKIQSCFRSKEARGEIYTPVPFGYKKDQKNHLIPDEEVSDVVMQIFLWKKSGRKEREIAKKLSAQGIPTPFTRRCQLGYMRNTSRVKDPAWQPAFVTKVLENPVYTGTMIYNRIAYDETYRKIGQNPREDWRMVPDSHPAIISWELFDEVSALREAEQAVRDERKKWCRQRRENNPNIFKGRIFCKECGEKLVCHWQSDGLLYFYCKFCHVSVSEKDLWNGIHKELRQRMEEHKNLKKLIQKNSGKSSLEAKKAALNREMEQMAGNIVRLESQKRSGYEQYVLGKLSKEKFLELKQGLENEIVEQKQEKSTKEKEFALIQEELQQKKQTVGSTEVRLTADNLQQYVKKIEVDRRKITCTEFVF